MTVNKRKKNTRQRGSHTYGWGSKKKHRGHGNRGGAGAGGTGKRADSKKPSIWGNPKYFGKYGFLPRGAANNVDVTNVGYIDQHVEKLTIAKLAQKQDGGFAIDLKALGVSKLLGTGKVTKKLFIKCSTASAKAIKSIEAAGGSVTVDVIVEKGAIDGSKGHTT